ncbi:MAG: hypothetical protein KKC76_17710 [Proteobacteria bacterium]|nr:hypothetical protein [Pseudomonadota bacterium]MBU4296150.1 hypothetical protein [Pseudomonadota bacterium]MCG2746780.1 hypothetical protein [Desulfobulbaceae bacterium]
MIEELTPQILMPTLFLVIVVVPILALLSSVVLLHRYRRAVARAMDATSGFRDSPTAHEAGSTPQPVDALLPERSGSSTAADLSGRALSGPWRNGLRYLIAGLAFALVLALSAQRVYPSGLGFPGFLVGVWIYLWPAFLVLAMIAPGNWRLWALCILGYCAGYALLGLWAGTVLNLPEYRFGAVVVPARSTVTPEAMIRLWLAVNGVPTLLMTLCLNRWIRAVAPLVLALLTSAVVGTLTIYLTLFSKQGVKAAVAVVEKLDIHIYWLLAGIFLVSLLGCGALGWVLARWIARSYRRGRLSEQSLLLDAVWLLFTGIYTMWLVLGGVAWVTVGPLAFVAFKLTWLLAASLSMRPPPQPVGLTFLRVFSLGRRSEALLEKLAKHWRHVGNIQLITGPDLATSTVQPHQFLDFLAGKLGQHFVGDHSSLVRSLAERDRGADPDGRFRINNFFCHADSWKVVLPHLVKDGNSVVMDLRSFDIDNDGCVHELHHLVSEVPFPRCLLVVDADTNTAFLDEILAGALASLQPRSPNYGRSLEELGRLTLGPGPAGIRNLVRRLADTTNGG